jgi:hypothetical protein
VARRLIVDEEEGRRADAAEHKGSRFERDDTMD